MADREQEKLKKQIEQLRRLPENKRCANCESLAVPYICLDFGTFVCTRCAAIHREFAHRAKSITASKFKPEEITFMKGNGADAAMYLANWNEQVYKLPGAGNEENSRARDFIQMKYEQKRWMYGQPQQSYPVQQFPAAYSPSAAQQPVGQPVQQYYQPAYQYYQPVYQQFAYVPPQQNAQFAQHPGMMAPYQQPQAPARPAVEDPFADMFGGGYPAQPQQQPQPQPQYAQPVQQQQPQFQQQYAPQQQFAQPPNQRFQAPPQPVYQFYSYPQQFQAQPQPQQFAPYQQFYNTQGFAATAQPYFVPAQNPQFQQAAFAQPAFGATNYNSAPAKFNAAAFVQPQAQPSTQGQKGYDMFSDLVNQSANAPAKPQKPAVTAQAPKPKQAGGDLLDF